MYLLELLTDIPIIRAFGGEKWKYLCVLSISTAYKISNCQFYAASYTRLTASLLVFELLIFASHKIVKRGRGRYSSSIA